MGSGSTRREAITASSASTSWGGSFSARPVSTTIRPAWLRHYLPRSPPPVTPSPACPRAGGYRTTTSLPGRPPRPRSPPPRPRPPAPPPLRWPPPPRPLRPPLPPLPPPLPPRAPPPALPRRAPPPRPLRPTPPPPPPP